MICRRPAETNAPATDTLQTSCPGMMTNATSYLTDLLYFLLPIISAIRRGRDAELNPEIWQALTEPPELCRRWFVEHQKVSSQPRPGPRVLGPIAEGKVAPSGAHLVIRARLPEEPRPYFFHSLYDFPPVVMALFSLQHIPLTWIIRYNIRKRSVAYDQK